MTMFGSAAQIGRDRRSWIRFGTTRWALLNLHMGERLPMCPICGALIGPGKQRRQEHEAHEARLLLLMEWAGLLDEEEVDRDLAVLGSPRIPKALRERMRRLEEANGGALEA